MVTFSVVLVLGSVDLACTHRSNNRAGAAPDELLHHLPCFHVCWCFFSRLLFGLIHVIDEAVFNFCSFLCPYSRRPCFHHASCWRLVSLCLRGSRWSWRMRLRHPVFLLFANLLTSFISPGVLSQ